MESPKHSYLKNKSHGSPLGVHLSPGLRAPGLWEREGVEELPNLIPSLYKPPRKLQTTGKNGLAGGQFPFDSPRMPALLPGPKWSLNKCWALDGSPSRTDLHFLFISNWQMKGFVLLLKEFQAFAASGGGGYFGLKRKGPRPWSSRGWLIVLQQPREVVREGPEA